MGKTVLRDKLRFESVFLGGGRGAFSDGERFWQSGLMIFAKRA